MVFKYVCVYMYVFINIESGRKIISLQLFGTYSSTSIMLLISTPLPTHFFIVIPYMYICMYVYECVYISMYISFFISIRPFAVLRVVVVVVISIKNFFRIKTLRKTFV